MSVILRKRKNKDGTTSLRLDIYHKGSRLIETLQIKLQPGSDHITKQNNKEAMDLARRIAAMRAAEITSAKYNITEDPRTVDVCAWMQSYIDGYTKKDKRNMQGALNRFTGFLRRPVTFAEITEELISAFQDRLLQTCKGEGAASYFSRFKKMLRSAYKARLISHLPEVRTKTVHAKTRDFLTLQEIQLLARHRWTNDEVKRAFLFSCSTGLRWSDIKTLDYRHVRNGILNKPQSKVDRPVNINLNATALKLLGSGSGLVFRLPSANGANKSVKKSVKDCGIEKDITWHNARHSFGTNLVYYGADVTVASSLLGHSSLKHTQRYVRAASEAKQRATDSLNFDVGAS